MLLDPKMSVYKYFGNGTIQIAGVSVLKKFGQATPLTREGALDILSGGGGILTPEDFDSVGFSPMEMKDKRERVGPEYMKKHYEALHLMRLLKDRLVNENGEQAVQQEQENV